MTRAGMEEETTMTHTQQTTNAATDLWEYRVERMDYDRAAAEERTLNEMGAQGWELVNALGFSRATLVGFQGGVTTGLGHMTLALPHSR